MDKKTLLDVINEISPDYELAESIKSVVNRREKKE